MVSECPAPLRSKVGATTHTSSLSWRAIRSNTARPWAAMPSSLESRMRRRAPGFRNSLFTSRGLGYEFRSTQPLATRGRDHLASTHVRLERLGHSDAAVGILIVL